MGELMGDEEAIFVRELLLCAWSWSGVRGGVLASKALVKEARSELERAGAEMDGGRGRSGGVIPSKQRGCGVPAANEGCLGELTMVAQRVGERRLVLMVGHWRVQRRCVWRRQRRSQSWRAVKLGDLTGCAGQAARGGLGVYCVVFTRAWRRMVHGGAVAVMALAG